uniref:Uncharacterized protein n=1 Tax=Rhizophora mucronata TaxID=61149 RepID=A0A2P2PPJ5_RHIMU
MPLNVSLCIMKYFVEQPEWFEHLDFCKASASSFILILIYSFMFLHTEHLFFAYARTHAECMHTCIFVKYF